MTLRLLDRLKGILSLLRRHLGLVYFARLRCALFQGCEWIKVQDIRSGEKMFGKVGNVRLKLMPRPQCRI
jgi:hypothetical protein